MGVRKFFWWMLKKYPKTLSDDAGGELDNFYIDLSELIHPCFRADHELLRPATYDELFSTLYHQIDRLFDFVRPRNLLFIAIDGVGSRSKINQIREGNYTSATAFGTAREIGEEMRDQFEKEGRSILSEEELQGLDSIIYTPGTEFMHLLSEKLRSYICQRMTDNSAWGNIKVILSDDKVPGEGEHKIMSFIRAQRASPGYDPNTRHCVYGTDTDLIMLALATHEVHFSILREDSVGVHQRKVCQFLNIRVLREYLSFDLEIPCSDKYEYENMIWRGLLMTSSSFASLLEMIIFHGCIDLLMHVYKKEFQSFGGYLVDMQKAEDETGGYINFKGVERFILALGAYEDKIFSKRSKIRNRKLKQTLENSTNAKNYIKDHQVDERVSHILASYAIVDNVDGVLRNTVELLLRAADCFHSQNDLLKCDHGTDKVKFGNHGWRERYYKEKFSAEMPEEIEATRKTLVEKYGEGLCWILLCYFSGVPSWSWFYPYHCGPLASEMKGLSQIKVEFQKGLPFKLFDQLMGVLPPTRAHLLPEAYKGLMIDKNSKIADFFYPTKTDKDLDGNSCPQQDIELPFIEEERLLSETKKLEKELKDHEKLRNTETLDLLFVKCSSEASQQAAWCSGSRAASNKIKGAVMMGSNIEGIKGILHMMPEDLINADDEKKGEYSRNILCMFYETHQDFRHIPRLLEGVNIPQKTVKKEDVVENILWHEHEKYGNVSAGNSSRFQNQRQKSEHTPERAGFWRRGGYGGTGSRREADMDLHPSSNNKPRQEGSSFWKSRSDVDDWRSNKQ